MVAHDNFLYRIDRAQAFGPEYPHETIDLQRRAIRWNLDNFMVNYFTVFDPKGLVEEFCEKHAVNATDMKMCVQMPITYRILPMGIAVNLCLPEGINRCFGCDRKISDHGEAEECYEIKRCFTGYELPLTQEIYVLNGLAEVNAFCPDACWINNEFAYGCGECVEMSFFMCDAMHYQPESIQRGFCDSTQCTCFHYTGFQTDSMDAAKLAEVNNTEEDALEEVNEAIENLVQSQEAEPDVVVVDLGVKRPYEGARNAMWPLKRARRSVLLD